jgi:MerR family transcriptional regulator, light-induced transcriptional regulator
MSSEEAKYNIKAVSKLLGIQPGTLRAWERRYQMIAPERNEAGHRLYTDRHLRVLRWLLNKVNQGFTISQAVSLLENNETEVSIENRVEQIKDYCHQLANDLLQALLSFNERNANELLNQAFSLYTLDKVIDDVLTPSLVRIGELWGRGETTTAHEHFATSFLRARISMILHNLPVYSYQPKVVCVCGPGETHEIGLLLFTLYLRIKGFEVIYLGTTIDDGDIDVVLKEVKPSFLFMSCTLKITVNETVKLCEELSNRFDGLNIGIGGQAFFDLSVDEKKQSKNFLVGMTKLAWDDWINSKMVKPI